MSDTPLVSLVCCDLLGAAALDGSALERAFAEAIATQGVVTGTKGRTSGPWFSLTVPAVPLQPTSC